MVAPILDKLLKEEVITKEGYNNVKSKPTTQEQMREIYELLHASGDTGKNIFYDILKEEEKFLAEDLEKHRNKTNGKLD